MKLIYRGKTKDVYEDGPDSVRMVFTDRVTENDAGEIDPGGNRVSGVIAPGQGSACLIMSSAIFQELDEKNITRTHMLSYDLSALTMLARKARLFEPGLEWVARWVCTGSFLRRYAMAPGISDGMKLPSPVFEITIKDDAAGDPLLVPSAIVALGIVDQKTMEKLLLVNAGVMQAIYGIFAARGLDLWDIKIEWGLDDKGDPILIDEVSPGCCRAFKSGSTERVQGNVLAGYFRKSA
jgi:phosphoribosylaminoimidazole-succinocarboxamide synthase